MASLGSLQSLGGRLHVSKQKPQLSWEQNKTFRRAALLFRPRLGHCCTNIADNAVQSFPA